MVELFKKKFLLKKTLMILSGLLLIGCCIFICTSLGLTIWPIIGINVTLSLILYTLGYSIVINDIVKSSTMIDQYEYLKNILMYIKDGFLIEVIKSRDLRSINKDETDLIKNLTKQSNTMEAILLISEILKKGSFTNYNQDRDERITEED